MKLYSYRLVFPISIICSIQTEKIYFSSKDIFEKNEIFNDARFSQIYNFKAISHRLSTSDFLKQGLKVSTGPRE